MGLPIDIYLVFGPTAIAVDVMGQGLDLNRSRRELTRAQDLSAVAGTEAGLIGLAKHGSQG